MNTLQTTLTALKSQLQSQKEASEYYNENVFSKEVASLETKISEWFSKFTGEMYKISIESGGEQISIFAPYQEEENTWRHNSIRVSYYGYYKEEAKAKLNYYSTECDYDNDATISYLKTLGMVATLLKQINYMMPKWKAEYQQYAQSKYAVFDKKISETEFAIRNVEKQILEEGLASYKKPGFKHTISYRTVCERHFEIDRDQEGAYTLDHKPQYFDLQHGRRRYDYVRVYAFEVVGEKRGKVDMNILTTCDPNEPLFTPITVTKAKFDDFIATVYNWENFQRDQENAKQTEKYNSHRSKFTEVLA